MHPVAGLDCRKLQPGCADTEALPSQPRCPGAQHAALNECHGCVDDAGGGAGLDARSLTSLQSDTVEATQDGTLRPPRQRHARLLLFGAFQFFCKVFYNCWLVLNASAVARAGNELHIGVSGGYSCLFHSTVAPVFLVSLRWWLTAGAGPCRSRSHLSAGVPLAHRKPSM